jgi:hypothetical protein
MKHSLFVTSFKFHVFASTAGGLRTCAGALFASFKKYAAHFLNHAFGVTEPNNAPNTGTDITQQANQMAFSKCLTCWVISIQL